jgi:hypothetical protein
MNTDVLSNHERKLYDQTREDIMRSSESLKGMSELDKILCERIPTSEVILDHKNSTKKQRKDSLTSSTKDELCEKVLSDTELPPSSLNTPCKESMRQENVQQEKGMSFLIPNYPKEYNGDYLENIPEDEIYFSPGPQFHKNNYTMGCGHFDYLFFEE